MDRLYLESNNMLEDVNRSLSMLEVSKDSDVADRLSQRVHCLLEQILSNCDTLDTLAMKEPAPKRKHFKLATDQLRYDCTFVRKSLSQIQYKLQRQWLAEKERADLLSRPYKANESTTVYLDSAELNVNDSLKSSHRNLDLLISNGYNILGIFNQ
ncbi:unnamed protein product [Soboliphyme baturini]|uniref:Mediator complex subunit 11 n=1 Tax=Soboliphyme baturini TaxID=241478 RepID=A0A183J7S7_9BILA|nr:unnamed protein product [Soboliphyme baturini]